jgi:hypothetical protein
MLLSWKSRKLPLAHVSSHTYCFFPICVINAGEKWIAAVTLCDNCQQSTGSFFLLFNRNGENVSLCYMRLSLHYILQTKSTTKTSLQCKCLVACEFHKEKKPQLEIRNAFSAIYDISKIFTIISFFLFKFNSILCLLFLSLFSSTFFFTCARNSVKRVLYPTLW